MSQSNSPRSANGLLSQMAEADYALIEPQLERSTMTRGQVFARPDEPVDDLWFPEAGFISQIAKTSENRRLEIGLFGREGVGPISSVLGIDRTPYEVIVQIEGTGLKIKAADVRAALEKSTSFRTLLSSYVQSFIVQMGHNALSSHSGVIGERLARWLLMCHDRIRKDDLQLTHEFLAEMLGVRRSSVTDAIHQLESVNIIRATRGNIRILDRARLEDVAGESYGTSEAEYKRLLGPFA